MSCTNCFQADLCGAIEYGDMGGIASEPDRSERGVSRQECPFVESFTTSTDSLRRHRGRPCVLRCKTRPPCDGVSDGYIQCDQAAAALMSL